MTLKKPLGSWRQSLKRGEGASERRGRPERPMCGEAGGGGRDPPWKPPEGATLPAPPSVLQPGSSLHSILKGFLVAKVPIDNHEWLNHWPLVVKLNLQPLSPPWRSDNLAKSYNPCNHRVGSSSIQFPSSKSHLVSTWSTLQESNKLSCLESKTKTKY